MNFNKFSKLGFIQNHLSYELQNYAVIYNSIYYFINYYLICLNYDVSYKYLYRYIYKCVPYSYNQVFVEDTITGATKEAHNYEINP
jgi:hypothetical protein